MNIHLNRAGQSLGQFTPTEVRDGYRSGRFLAGDLAWRDGMAMWKPLGEVIDELAPDAGGEVIVEVAPTPTGMPWEHRSQKGFVNSLVETIRDVLFEPARTFAAMPPAGGLGAPLFFFVLMGTLGGLAGIFYQNVLHSISPAAGTPEQQAIAKMMASTMAIGGMIMVLPLLLAAGAFISAGLLHLALMLTGGAKKSFEATFRVACYAGGSTAVLQLLPVFGAILASVWNLALVVIGLSQVHGISRGRACIAVLLPSLVCCGLVLFALIFLAAAVGGAMHSLGVPTAN
ncbi:MAG: YIP1 family protein [Chthoniobacterales bacterium]|jgi:hypothetical protein